MKTLTITSDNEEALNQVKALAESLNMPVQEHESEQKLQSDSKEKLRKLFAEARKLNIGKQIPDPVAWQREQRKDRKLPYRD